MTIFIPQWSQYRDKKPGGLIGLDESHELFGHTYFSTYFHDNIALNNDNISLQTDGDAVIENAAVFNGGGRLLLQNNPLVPQQFTLLAGVNPKLNTVDHCVFDVNNQELVIWLDTAASTLKIAVYAGSVLYGTKFVPINTLTHIAVVVDGVSNTAEIYINGTFDKSGNIGSKSWENYSNAALGANYSNFSKLMVGTIEYFHLFDTLLDNEQIFEFSQSPLQILKPRQIWFPVTSGAGGGVNLTPTQASFGLSGQTPTLLAGYSEAPTQGSFTFTGLTPSLGIGNAVNLTPTQATFTFTGLTPIESIGYTDTAIQGSSTFTGLNSSLSSGFIESPIQLSTLWSGQTPTIDSGVSLQAVQGTQSFSGLTPSLLSGYVDTATQATFLFVGGTPSANIGGGINLTPAQGSFAFTGSNPVPSFGQVNTPAPASFSFTGLVPSLQAGDAVNLTPAQGSFTFTGLTSTIALGFSNAPTQATFLWSGLVPSTNLVPSEITLSQASIDAIADAVWQKAIETYTAEEMMRVFMSALSGKREGLGTATEKYMAVDGVTPRITLTADANGNGTPVINGAP